MSASDRTSIKKYNSMNNKFSSKSSGNETEKKKINVIRNVNNSDVFGTPIEKTWFNIPITNTNISVCANAIIKSSIITTPIISKIPNMTIPLAIKIRKITSVSSFSISSMTSNQIVLQYAGNYTYVNISRDGTLIATEIYATTYTDSGLTGNTVYTYAITPKHVCNIGGKISCNTGIPSIIVQSTLPNITSLSVSSETASQIILNYTGNYTSVSISRNGSNIATHIIGSTYTDIGLTANTSYIYIVTPYNSSNDAGIISTITQKTLPNITSLIVFSKINSTIVLYYTGNYTYVSISRDGTIIAPNITATAYTDTGLIENTYYTYVVTPYNSVGAGTSSTITQNTLLNITSLSVSNITASQMILNYTGNYTYVGISRYITTYASSSVVIASNVYGITYTDVSGLTGNTSYTYELTPYDITDNSGIISTITHKTLSNITTLTVSDISASQIVLNYTGNYTYLDISRNGTTIATNVSGTTTYTDSSGLTANTLYTYIVKPYDISGNLGITSTIARRTLSKITSLTVSDISASRIVLNYTGIYTYVSISKNGTTIATDISGTTMYDSSGLTANTLYTYIITPYDISGNSGITSTIAQRTLSNITSLTVSDISASQMVLNYTGNYTYVSIYRNGTTIATDISGTTTYTDSSGLTANTSYTYIVKPYDISSNLGIAMSITKITLPNITSLTVVNTGTTHIGLVYSGNYAYVSISRNGTSIATDISGITYTDSSGLTANTSYTYVVTPYNSSGLSGSTLSITEVTLPVLTSLSISNRSTSSSIILDYTGSYTVVNIAKTTVIDSSANTTSYIYVVTPYNSAGVAGSTLSITEVTLT